MGGTESCMGVCGMELGQRALWVGQRRGGGACPGSCVGWCVGGRVGGREEGEAWSAVLYGGSLTVPRAKAAGTRGRGVPGDGAWHWDVRTRHC